MTAHRCTVAEIGQLPSGTLVSTIGAVSDVADNGSGWDAFLTDGRSRVILDIGPTTYSLVSQHLTDGTRVAVSGYVAHDWTGPELHVETVHAAEVAS